MKKIVAILIIVGVFLLSVIKINQKIAPENSDKLVHFVMYFFVAWSFRNLEIKRYILFSIMYGIFLECIQHFLPYRSFSIFDIFANTLGAFFYGVIIRFASVREV